MVPGRMPGNQQAKAPLGLVPSWNFGILMEEPRIESDDSLVGRAGYFHLQVICHERRPYRDRYSGCKEYKWRLRRRFSDFQRLDTELRAAHLLPPSVAAPKKTLFRHWCPSLEFVKQRSTELHKYLLAALAASETKVMQTTPDHARDVLDLCAAWPEFFGMQDKGTKMEVKEPAKHRSLWAPPSDAEERPAALVHSLDRGVYVWGEGLQGTRLQKFTQQSLMGSLTVSHAEVRLPQSLQPSSPTQKLSLDLSAAAIQQEDPKQFRPSTLGLLFTPRLMRSPAASTVTSPTALAKHLMSPRPSQAGSTYPSPPKSTSSTSSEGCLSFSSVSTADTETGLRGDPFGQPSAAVWLELDLVKELERQQEHNKWWTSLMEEVESSKKTQELRKPPKLNGTFTVVLPGKQERAQIRGDFEKMAALFRELSTGNEDLHRILGYGAEGDTFVVVQPAADRSCGLHSIEFSHQRCHQVLGQVVKALCHLHSQHLCHGHLSPESLVVEDGPLGFQARLAWTPGQRRSKGSVSTTTGFRGPGKYSAPAADIWALACIILVWWINFDPAPHPWTQFARSARPEKDIRQALAQKPPELPKALLDMYSAAAMAEEPSHTFLSLLGNLLTRCLIWCPEERPPAEKLLQHRFFEQPL